MDNSSPKFCMHCRNPIQSGQNFCGKCGAKQLGQAQPSVGQAEVSRPEVVPVKNGDNQRQIGSKKNKNVWMWTGVGTAVLLFVVILMVVLLGSGKKSRTMMVYMIGSDLESDGSAASLDINEMKGAKRDSEDVKLIIYTGGAKRWALDEIDPDENAIFEVTGGSINKVQTYEKSTMTKPENLIEFVDFVYENYPADLYDLILWDHGGGPVYGYGSDENSLFGASMSIPVLTRALSDTELVKAGRRFDLIGFDACLMGSAEVARAVAPYSDYMVASEEVEPGDGWNYGFLGDFQEDKYHNTEELGRGIVDHYISYYENEGRDYDLSLSLIDLRKIDALADSIDVLFAKVKDEINAQNYSQYSRTMTRDKVYGYNGRDSKSYDLVDLIDLCGSLKEGHDSEVSGVASDLDETVIYSRSNMDNTNGLSVYFLNYNKKEADKMMTKYRDVALSDKYYEFLDKYKGFVTGERKVTRATYTDLKEEEKDGVIEIELADELKDNYQSGEIIVFRKLGENKYMPVYRSSEVELEDNKLKATTYNLQFVIEVTKGDEKDYGWSFMYEKERTDEYADYATFGVLYYEDENSIIGMSPKNYEMFIRIPKDSKEAEIRDIRVSSDTDMASKTNLDPEKIELVDFLLGAYKLYNDAGELDYNMESHGTMYGTEVSLKDGDDYKIRLEDLNFDFGDIYGGEFGNGVADYYASFVVHDTQGDAHQLNLVHINNK